MKVQQATELIAALAWQHRLPVQDLLDRTVARLQEQRTDAQYAAFADNLGLDRGRAARPGGGGDPRHVVVTPEQKKESTRKRLDREIAAARKAVAEAKSPAEQKTAREVLRRLEEARRGLGAQTVKLTEEDRTYAEWARFSGIEDETLTVTTIVAADEDEMWELWRAWSA
jgi:hypothetical protein